MGCDVSLLGIGADFIHWIDGTNMEVCIMCVCINHMASCDACLVIYPMGH